MNFNKPIVLIGMPGVGKTAIGKSLSRMLDVKHIDTDGMIESEQASSVYDIIENKTINRKEITKTKKASCCRRRLNENFFPKKL